MRTSKRTISLRTGGDRRFPPAPGSDDVAAALVVVVDDIEGIEREHGSAGLSEVLRIAGQRIRVALREDDFTARWGAEELVVVLRNTSLDAAVHVGQRIRVAVSQPITLHDGRSLVPTCSIGAAGGEPDRPEVVERAQKALVLAKSYGGNCVRRALPMADRWTAGAVTGL